MLYFYLNIHIAFRSLLSFDPNANGNFLDFEFFVQTHVVSMVHIYATPSLLTLVWTH